MKRQQIKDELWMLDDSVAKMTALIRSESIEAWKSCVEGEDCRKKVEMLRRMSIRLTDLICESQDRIFGGPELD